MKCDDTKTYNYLRLNILPDGGVVRLRVLASVKLAGLKGHLMVFMNYLPLKMVAVLLAFIMPIMVNHGGF